MNNEWAERVFESWINGNKSIARQSLEGSARCMAKVVKVFMERAPEKLEGFLEHIITSGED